MPLTLCASSGLWIFLSGCHFRANFLNLSLTSLEVQPDEERTIGAVSYDISARTCTRKLVHISYCVNTGARHEGYEIRSPKARPRSRLVRTRLSLALSHLPPGP